MSCRLDRLWPPILFGFQLISGHFHNSDNGAPSRELLLLPFCRPRGPMSPKSAPRVPKVTPKGSYLRLPSVKKHRFPCVLHRFCDVPSFGQKSHKVVPKQAQRHPKASKVTPSERQRCPKCSQVSSKVAKSAPKVTLGALMVSPLSSFWVIFEDSLPQGCPESFQSGFGA